MVLCNSQKLYFRTSVGPFPISSINYTSKTLIISHPSCSDAQHFISPLLLSDGFQSPSHVNSLLLFNCYNHRNPVSRPVHDCSRLHGCETSSSYSQEKETAADAFCLFIDDLAKLDRSFNPKHLNCTHYSRVYRKTLEEDDNQRRYELGTSISFDLRDHVPDMCKECDKPNGNCGVGLKCVCHPKKCEDKIYSGSGSQNHLGIIFYLLLFIAIETLQLMQ